MHLRVRHQLRYEYSAPIFLQPHTLYLYPRIYPHQKLIDYQIRISPSPDMIVRNVDTEGNVQQLVYFVGECQSLSVDVSMVVESNPFNTFGFVLYPFETEKLPLSYLPADKGLLLPYLDRTNVTLPVEQYARQIAAEAGWQTVPFLSQLCATIRSTFVYEAREEGAAHLPEHTLLTRKGSCRDYAVLFIACCRSLGLAARFVSGYLYGNPQQDHELHAWVEVYLPGAGWRGFDPTEGSVVIHKHLFLAASALHDQLPPLRGTFRGQAESTMTATVEINGDD